MSRLLLVTGIVFLVVVIAGCGSTKQAADRESETKTQAREEAKTPAGGEPAGRPPKELAADGSAVDLQRLIPDDALLAVSLRPRRLLTEPALADVPLEQLGELLAYDENSGVNFLGRQSFWLRMIDKQLSDVEQAVYVVGEFPLPQLAPETPRDPDLDDDAEPQEVRVLSPPEIAAILRFASPVDPTAVAGAMFRAEPRQYEGFQYWGRKGDPQYAAAAAVIDQHTLIVGSEGLVKRMLARSKAESVSSGPVAKAIDADADFAVAVAPKSIGPLQSELPDGFGATLALVNVASLQIRLTPVVSAKLSITSSTGADRLHEQVQQGIDNSKVLASRIDFGKEFPEPVLQAFARLKQLAQVVLDKATVELDGEQITVSVSDVATPNDIAELLQPLAPLLTESPAYEMWLAATKPLENATAEIMRRLIPSAAGATNEAFMVIARGATAPSPYNISDQAVSISLLIDKIVLSNEALEQLYPERATELQFGDEDFPKPSELAATLSRTAPLGYVTMILPEYITDVTCRADRDTASGEVLFQVPALYRGKISYTARRIGHGWQITEFYLPRRGWKFLRQDDGSWLAGDRWGNLADLDRFPKPAQVDGVVTLDGRPVSAGRLGFYHQHDSGLVDVLARTDEQGAYTFNVPPGEYYLTIRGPGVPEKYGEPHTSGLRVNVQDGRNTLDFDLRGE